MSEAAGLLPVAAVLLAVLGICLLTADDYGISWDEKVQRDYGVLAANYFRTLGEDKRCNSYLNLRYYTPVYETILHIVAQHVAPWQQGPPAYPTPLAGEYAVRHTLNSVVGVSALVATACVAQVARRWRRSAPLPVVAVLLLAATPRFHGHYFANTKDIPFAAAFAWSMVGIFYTLDAVYPGSDAPIRAVSSASDGVVLRLPWCWGVVTAAAVGFTVSLRSAGLLLLPMAVVGLFATLANAYATHEKVQLPQLTQALLWVAVTAMIMWVAMVALWPAALEAPLSHPVQTVLESVHFSTVVRMRFSGEDAWSNTLPRRYYLEMFGATLPLPTVVCVCGGLAQSVCTTVARRRVVATSASAGRSPAEARLTVDVPLLLITMWACMPMLMFIAKPLNVYDGVRHFLFIMPAFALLGAEPLGMLLEHCDSLPRAFRWASVMLISLSAVPSMVALHPYQSSYFNDLVGGLGTVSQEPPAYDTDYWATCYRAASEWSVHHAGGAPRHILAAANSFSKECVEPYVPPGWNVSTLLDAAAPRLPRGVDYYLSTTRWGMDQLYPDSTVVHRVERGGATLCLVKSDRADAQPFAHPNSRSATPGGLPHQLLTEETIRDGNTPPPSPPPAPVPAPQAQTSAAPVLNTPSEPHSTTRDTDVPITTHTIAATPPQPDLVSMAHKPLGVPQSDSTTNRQQQSAVDPHTGLQPVTLPSGSVDDTASAMYYYEAGNELRDSGRFDEAIQRFLESINRDNSSPAAYNNLGALLEARHRVPEALHIYELAVERHPDFALGFFNLGSRLLLGLADVAAGAAEVKQLVAATSYLQRSVNLNPAYFPAWSNLGDAKRAANDIDGAVTCYLEALARSPTYNVARNNLGNALKTDGRLDEAAIQYELAVKASSSSAGSTNASPLMWANLGAVYMEQDRLQDALYAYSNATSADPTYAPAYTNRGRIYEDQGLVDLALQEYRQAYNLERSDVLEMSMAFLLPPIMPVSPVDRELSMQHIMDYLDSVLVEDGGSLGRGSFELRNPIDDLGSMAFYLTYYGVNLRPLRQKLAAVALKGYPGLRYEAAHCASRSADEDRRVEIGIASKSLFDHSTGKWILGMIRELDRSKFRVTVVMIPPLHDDKVASAVRDAADKVVIPTAELDGIRTTIADLLLDVLVLADVGMDTTLYAVSFARLAPVQVGIAAAWPVTTGVPTVDYMASFDVEIAAAQDHYSEKLIRLPGILPYSPPVPHNMAEELKGLHMRRDQLSATRQEFGMPPPETIVYLCIQAPYKFHPDFDAALAEILRTGPPDSVVALVWGKTRHWTNALIQRFAQTIGAELTKRVILLPRIASSRMPKLLAAADVVLDTWPYGGGVTSFEALNVGRPLITLAYETMPGRFTYAMYLRMGIWDCIAFDANEYVQIAVALGNNSTLRQEVSAKIVASTEHIFDDRTAIRAFEQEMISAVARTRE